MNIVIRNYAMDELQVTKLSMEIANGSSVASEGSLLQFCRVTTLLFKSCHTQNMY